MLMTIIIINISSTTNAARKKDLYLVVIVAIVAGYVTRLLVLCLVNLKRSLHTVPCMSERSLLRAVEPHVITLIFDWS